MAGSPSTRLAGVAFVALAALLAAGAARQADAGGVPSRAVVIVGSTPMCISFNGTINGVEALERAGVQATTAGFDGLGSGVCAIEGQGCPSSACFQCALPSYWHYFRASSGGAFSASPVGASSTRVEDGDVEAWVWGARIGPPDPVRVEDVCGPAPSPPPPVPTAPAVTSPAPGPGPGSPGEPTPAPGQSAGSAADRVSEGHVSGSTTSNPVAPGATATPGQGDATTTAPDAAGAGKTVDGAGGGSGVAGDVSGGPAGDLTADLAADPNLASAPRIDTPDDPSVASWIPVAIGLVLVGGGVGWAVWRRRAGVR